MHARTDGGGDASSLAVVIDVVVNDDAAAITVGEVDRGYESVALEELIRSLSADTAPEATIADIWSLRRHYFHAQCCRGFHVLHRQLRLLCLAHQRTLLARKLMLEAIIDLTEELLLQVHLFFVGEA